MAKKENPLETENAMLRVIAEHYLGDVSIEDAMANVGVFGVGDNQTVRFVPPDGGSVEVNTDAESESEGESPQASEETPSETSNDAGEGAGDAQAERGQASQGRVVDLPAVLAARAAKGPQGAAPPAKSAKQKSPDDMDSTKGGELDQYLAKLASGGE